MNELAPRKTSPKTNTQNKQNQNKLPYIQVEAVEAVRKAWGSLYDLVDDAERGMEDYKNNRLEDQNKARREFEVRSRRFL